MARELAKYQLLGKRDTCTVGVAEVVMIKQGWEQFCTSNNAAVDEPTVLASPLIWSNT